jgi:chromate transporter
VAGGCFIVPAMLIVYSLAVVYVRFGALPQVHALFYGLQPVVVAVISYAIIQLAYTAIRTTWHWVIAMLAAASTALGTHELLILGVCGLAGALTRANDGSTGAGQSARAVLPVLVPQAAVAGAAVSPGTLFYVFFKAGALLFGSGYVLIAFLRADLVERLHWLTERQLVDAIAVGQFTPGPVFTTATFVGYLVAGSSGAFLATAAIFLPAFVYVALSAPVIPMLRRSRLLAGMLDGVNIASLALMAWTAVQLGRTAIVDPWTGVLAVGALIALVSRRANPAWVMAVGALVGIGVAIASR